ncbi:MAG: SGNH/GDSL hydrolase family protein [Planctomycetota bacterium]
MTDAQARSPWRKRLLVLAISTVASMLVIELVFRALDLRGYHEARTRDWKHAILPPEEYVPGVLFQFKPHAKFRLEYDSNPDGYFDERNGLDYETNAQGFRGAEWTDERTPGTERVLVLGDSFTFGEGVKLEDTFCVRLASLLTKERGRPVEVINCGVSAWSTDSEIAFLEHRGLRTKPDLVLVVYVLNDADYAGGLDLWREFRGQYEKDWLKHSYFASYAYSMYARGRVGRRYVEDTVRGALSTPEKWQKSFDLLAKGDQLSRAAGARFGVCVFPFLFDLSPSHPMKPIHAMIRDACAKNGIPALDLFDTFVGQRDTSLWVHPSDQHPNAKANALAAEAMARFVIAERLLDAGEEGR